MLEESLAAYNIDEQDNNEELIAVHDWKRKQKLRREFVDDGEGINDEVITLLESFDMNGEEELDDDIVPTAKELVWVLGKVIFNVCAPYLSE